MCPFNDEIEDTEHFLLLYHSFKEDRRNLLAGSNDILKTHGKPEGLNDNIVQILLNRDEGLPLTAKKANFEFNYKIFA